MKLSTPRMKRTRGNFLFHRDIRSPGVISVLVGVCCLLFCCEALAVEADEMESIFVDLIGFHQQAEWWWDFDCYEPGMTWTQLAEQSRSRWSSSQSGSAPVIRMAGYMDSDVNYRWGGDFWMLAWVDDPDDDIESVEIYYEGNPTGVYLLDNGRSGDFGKGDGLYGIKVSIPEKVVQPNTFILELKATDQMGNTSELWPYMTLQN